MGFQQFNDAPYPRNGNLLNLACQDEDADVAALWKEVWEEGTGSGAAAVRLYLPEIVPLVAEGLASQQWGRKRGAAKSVVSLADVGETGILSAHAQKLADHLLQVWKLPCPEFDLFRSLLCESQLLSGLKTFAL